ncbi:twin-arginine translocase subunit TatC [Arcticibacterium luteifluviistationis]|uniref:Sec-independent protein translocase protein TatC n=1 Tax=Arcticibacterium luteifluviistationis TaxID=1784714 RepID=A0A2Z4G9Z0_9BACT|nr:twin-arginine translocase subunit TatC [Arcticibacterium luteifluviistationis]AWV98006.1 twin-arginine translocase subunit TatC [Arcticibacterium luteifluviistationis]
MALDQSPEIEYDDEEENEGDEGTEMTFIEHLEALRWHLIRAIVAILVFMIGAWFSMGFIFNKVILGPAKPEFWTYRKLCEIGDMVGIPSLCVDKLNFSLMSREVSGQFMMALTASAIIGLLFAFPYIFWEIWRFIKPGLKMTEKKASRGAVFFVTLLFFMGIMFGYYIVAPFAINFLVNFQIDPSIENQFDIQSYIGVLATLTLACGITFQLPMAIFVLTKVGVVTPKFLREYRKHAIVVLLIVAAIITPSPDMISQILVAIPLYILYEVSVLVSQREFKRMEKEAAE